LPAFELLFSFSKNKQKSMKTLPNISVAAAPYIVLPTCKGLLLIYVNQIVRIQSISNYSKIYLANSNAVVVSKVLRWFEDSPALIKFIRIHRTHLINTAYIERCGVQSSGFVFLSNGEKLKIARRKKAVVVQRLIQANNPAIRKCASLPLHFEQLKNRVA
jgi:two-component system LytT family response regulator